MFSMPPERIVFASPTLMVCVASLTAYSPEPHTLLMVSAPTLGCTPPWINAWRAGAWPSPAVSTLPRITSSTVSGSSLVRVRVSLITPAASLGAGIVERPPMKRPIGVRNAETMTARSILFFLQEHTLSRAYLLFAQNAARDDDALNFAGAFADLAQFGIAIHALHLVFTAVTVATVHLDGLRGDTHRHLGREQLGHGRVACELGAGVLAPGRVVHEQARGVNLGGHVGDLHLVNLKIHDARVKLPAVLAELDGRFHGSLGDAQREGADRNTAAFERLHEGLEAAAFGAKQVFLRHFAVVEHDLERSRGAQA